MNLKSKNDSIILALETSCDETSAAVILAGGDKIKILSNVIASQINIHRQYGGVVPEIAAREHLKNILPVVDESLAAAKIKPAELDLLAVVAGPGLITSLLVGVEAAKALSWAWQKPLIGINHLSAHIAANFYQNQVEFPTICLVVSGGHTELIYLKDYWQYQKIGQTVDDAAGEAFDKVAKLLGLGYPGGPAISACAEELRIKNYELRIKLPRPMIKSNDFNFSFSGLKTAVLYATKKMTAAEVKKRTPEICYEFQEAVVEVLTAKTIKAGKKFGVRTVMLAGGVAANKRLRGSLEAAAKKSGFKFLVPEFKLCTDNAAMAGVAAYYLSLKSKPRLDGWKKIKADPNWELK